jgi:hypothetical protein
MSTTFTKLNEGWNAEPNGQAPEVSFAGKDLLFAFLHFAVRPPSVCPSVYIRVGHSGSESVVKKFQKKSPFVGQATPFVAEYIVKRTI